MDAKFACSHCANDVNFSIQVKKTLGWEPVVPLKEGLALMVEDFAHRLGQCTASLLQHIVLHSNAVIVVQQHHCVQAFDV